MFRVGSLPLKQWGKIKKNIFPETHEDMIHVQDSWLNVPDNTVCATGMFMNAQQNRQYESDFTNSKSKLQ